MGKASCTKETLPDFREWCRGTRHPLLFRGLTGCQRTPENGPGVTLRKLSVNGWKTLEKRINQWLLRKKK